MKQPVDAVWLSTEQAGQRLGLQQRTVYRLIDTGQLPGYRFGRLIRVQASDVDSFIEAHRIQRGELSHLHRLAPTH